MKNPNTPGDEELVRHAQQGKLGAFTALYERYLPIVYNRVRFSIPAEDVEDVTQDVFISVMKSLQSFRYEARFNTWLRTLICRQIADYYRSRKPQDVNNIELSNVNPQRLPNSVISEKSEQIDNLIILRQCMRILPDHYKEVILLRFVEGMQFDEIAQLRNQTLEATKSLFRRAIAALQKLMKENE